MLETFKRSGPLAARPDVTVKGSVGLGNWAGVPWIALLDSRVTSSTQNGVYPVILFREDMTGAYLTVAQGTQLLKKEGRRHMLEQLAIAAQRVRAQVPPDLDTQGFDHDTPPRLGTGSLARDYEASTIVHKLYERALCQRTR